jgi:hypothetical protein
VTERAGNSKGESEPQYGLLDERTLIFIITSHGHDVFARATGQELSNRQANGSLCVVVGLDRISKEVVMHIP